jgi:hypothetical protein
MPSKIISDDAPDGAAVPTLPRNLAERIQLVEASLAKLQVELEDAEGEHRDALENLIEQAQHVLMRLRVLH